MEKHAPPANAAGKAKAFLAGAGGVRRRPRPASALQPPAGESPVPSPGLALCDLCAASDKLSQTKSRVLSQNRHSRPSEVPWLGVSFALWGPSKPMEASCPACCAAGPGEHDCAGASDYAGQKVARTPFQNVPGTDLPYFSCPSLLVSLAPILQREEGCREHAKPLSSGLTPPKLKHRHNAYEAY